MQEEKDMANLLSQEKVNPMDVDHQALDKSSKTADHGDEEAPSGSSVNEKQHKGKDFNASHTSQKRRFSELSAESNENELTARGSTNQGDPQSRHDRRRNETSGSRRTSEGSTLASILKSSLESSMTSNASSKGSSPAPVPRPMSKSLVLPKRVEEAHRQKPRLAQSMVASSPANRANLDQGTVSRASNMPSISSLETRQTNRQSRRHSTGRVVTK